MVIPSDIEDIELEEPPEEPDASRVPARGTGAALRAAARILNRLRAGRRRPRD